MRFYLGTHEPYWIGRAGVPLFVSVRRFRRINSTPRATAGWAMDSGGFTELSMHGKWTVSARDYAQEVAMYQERAGLMEWASPQDWMCEPHILEKTGLTVLEHQQRTIDNFIELCNLAPSIEWRPVVQGWHIDDYLSHVEQYRSAGVHLERVKLVGVGSVCRRQESHEISRIMEALSGLGLKLHGFGVKIRGMAKFGKLLSSADSMAWSFAARKLPPLDGCTHRRCNNCIRFALQWREGLVNKLKNPRSTGGDCAPGAGINVSDGRLHRFSNEGQVLLPWE